MGRPGQALVPALLAVAVALSAPLLASSAAPAASRPKLHGNNFYANCRFSHTSNDDPIVHPGQPGRSHAHTFFGNTSANAASTPASLRAARTTCKPRADKAAYWVPTLFKDGREVRPAKGQFYYNLRGFDQMRPFPAGLKMVAGDAHARRPQSRRVVYWTCGGSGGVRLTPMSTAPTRCPVVRTQFRALVKKCRTCAPVRTRFRGRVKTFLQLHVNYPDCWDGKRLDSPDHHSHMAHSRDYVCPASHPVKVPLIRLMIRYPITDARDVVLASGGQLTGHADFVNAWDQRVLAKLVHECFRDRPCDPAR